MVEDVRRVRYPRFAACNASQASAAFFCSLTLFGLVVVFAMVVLNLELSGAIGRLPRVYSHKNFEDFSKTSLKNRLSKR
jgi:hypothetical protein